MANAYKAIADRINNAQDQFINNVIETFGTTETEAEKVFSVFKQAKVIKLDAVIGRYQLKHGAYWEQDVIARAIKA